MLCFSGNTRTFGEDGTAGQMPGTRNGKKGTELSGPMLTERAKVAP